MKSRKAKSGIAVIAALVMAVCAMSTLLVACGKDKISLDKTSAEMYAGDVLKLEAALSNPELDVEWTTSDNKVATVRRGTVTAVGVGTATITASLESGVSATCTVTVKDRTVTISEKTKEVNYDELGDNKTVTLSATSSDNGTITWSSSDTSVATVSGGVVTFAKPKAQSAEVTITAQRGLAKDSCVITVTCPSIPDDYYALMKETNANVVANPGKWYYHADGAMGTDYNFSEEPSYGNASLNVELDKFSDPTGGKRFYFRYQPTFEEGTKYTMKMTVTTNIDGTLGVGTASVHGGVVSSNVKANEAKNITYIGDVNTAEPFHLNINKINGAIPEKVSIKITNILVKVYEKGDEVEEEEPEIPDYELPSIYAIVRGTAEDTCTDAGRWYWLIDPQTGNEELSEAKFDNGTVTLALHSTKLAENTYHVRYQPRLAVGTKARATFTVSLSAEGSVQFGLNSDQNKDGNSRDVAAGASETITYDFTVTKNRPFVIQVTATDKEAPMTMTVTDISFVEKLPETFTVTYNSLGGSDIDAASVLEGNAIESFPTPVKADHTFLGWFDNAECEGTALTAPYVPKASITLYAKWIENTASVYTVTFDSKGGSAVAPQTVEAGGETALPAPTKDNFVFGGWFDNEACAGTAVESPYTPSANITLYAKWLNAYTVSFDVCNGNRTLDSVKVTEGETKTLPAPPTRRGFTFDGWYENADYSGNAVANDYAPVGDIKLYAKWTAQTQYSVIDGGVDIPDKNRDAWYHKVGNGSVSSAEYNNGTVTLNVTGAAAGNDNIQLRYLPNLADGKWYTVSFKMTASVEGNYKVTRHQSTVGEKTGSLVANDATEISFTTCVEKHSASEYRIVLVRFAPATAGDVTVTLSDIGVVETSEPEPDPAPAKYEIIEGLNGVVRANPLRWYYYVGDGKKDTYFNPAPQFDNGTVTMSCSAMGNYAYQLRYLPCKSTQTKTYTVTFTVKAEASGDFDAMSVFSTNAKNVQRTDGENGEVQVTCTFAYAAGADGFYIQFMPAEKIEQSVTITVSNISFTEAA